MKIDYGDLLVFLFAEVAVWSRSDLGWILAGVRGCRDLDEADAALQRLLRRGMIQGEGRGSQVRYTILPAAVGRTALLRPREQWDRPWDGKWRVITYDLPEVRRKDRKILWTALRTRKLGLLQRSVWVWPHPVEPILSEIIRAEGVPECFCGFEAGRLFLCSAAEVVESAWDFEEIGRRHGTYLQHLVANERSLKSARDLAQLGRVVRVERDAYHNALALDPFLPRALCPSSYEGFAVEERRDRFRRILRRRLHELIGK